MSEKTTVLIQPYGSRAFPWMAKVGIHSWVFETVEDAKIAMEGRFGACKFIEKR